MLRIHFAWNKNEIWILEKLENRSGINVCYTCCARSKRYNTNSLRATWVWKKYRKKNILPSETATTGARCTVSGRWSRVSAATAASSRRAIAGGHSTTSRNRCWVTSGYRWSTRWCAIARRQSTAEAAASSGSAISARRSSATWWCTIGRRWSATTVGRCSVGARWSSSGWSAIGAGWCSIATRWCSVARGRTTATTAAAASTTTRRCTVGGGWATAS